MKRLSVIAAILLGGCDLPSPGHQDRIASPVVVESADPVSCDPNIAEILVDPESEDVYTPGECFGASECWANTYTDEIEIACYFPGCEDADVVSFTPQVVEVTLENPCAN